MSKLTYKDKVKIYEELLSNIAIAAQVYDTERINYYVQRIARWARGHTIGNGQFDDKTQQQIIDQRTVDLINHIKE